MVNIKGEREGNRERRRKHTERVKEQEKGNKRKEISKVPHVFLFFR